MNIVSKSNHKLAKQKKWPFVCLVSFIFILIASLIATFCIRVNISNSIWKKNEISIGKTLAPLCSSKKYVYHDIEASIYKFDFFTKLSEDDVQKFCPNQSDSSFLQLLAYTKDYYYFLNVNIKKGGKTDSIICRVTLDCEKYEELLALTGKTKKWIRGYDEYFFFQFKNKYFVYNFKTLTLRECGTGSYESSVIENGVANYRSKYMNPRGEVERIGNYCTFTIDNTSVCFDELLIDENIYSHILEYNFRPYYNLSYKNGLTSLLYYANPDWLSFMDCLIVDYDRETNSIIGYQLFNNVDVSNFHLYRQLDF